MCGDIWCSIGEKKGNVVHSTRALNSDMSPQFWMRFSRVKRSSIFPIFFQLAHALLLLFLLLLVFSLNTNLYVRRTNLFTSPWKESFWYIQVVTPLLHSSDGFRCNQSLYTNQVWHHGRPTTLCCFFSLVGNDLHAFLLGLGRRWIQVRLFQRPQRAKGVKECPVVAWFFGIVFVNHAWTCQKLWGGFPTSM